MSYMKCPFCGKELERYWYEDFECWCCPDLTCKGYYMTATKDMWQELIRTRKALDVAVDALTRCQKNTPANYTATQAVFLLAKNFVFIDKALEEITALEQKDK